jgi:uncharacterized alkaline shock family protein YloU
MADLEAVAAAALGCPLISGLTGGRFGEVATYLPGRRLLGVREVDGTIEIHVVAKWGTPLPEVAEVVRAAVAAHAGAQPVVVFVDDIEVPDDPQRARLEEAGIVGP